MNELLVRLRRVGPSIWIWTAIGCLFAPLNAWAADPAAAQPPARFIVKSIALRGVSGEPVTADDVLSQSVQLTQVGDHWTAAPADADHPVAVKLNDLAVDGQPRVLDAAGVKAIATAVLSAYQNHHVAAVRVNIPQEALARITEGGDGVLVIDVREGHIGQVRTMKRDGEGQTEVTGGKYDLVKELSPVQEQDMVRLDAVSRYVYWLNRHPGRRVDAAVTRDDPTGDLVLEYLVSESKPWVAYVQLSNTGTESTDLWREQFGFVHNNLTGHDDILALNYVTGAFDTVHAFSGSYELPLPEAPRLRARVSGNWSKYTSSTVGLATLDFEGENYGMGGELICNIFQHDALFVDAVAGLRFQDDYVNNKTLGMTGHADFLMPSAGLRLDRRGNTSYTTASVSWETNLSGLIGTEAHELTNLGRSETDKSWNTLTWSASRSMYIEPLLQSDWGQAGVESTMAHELYASVRGQYVMAEHRVPPSFTSAIGGFFTVRGYPESFAAADNSVIATGEYRLHIPRLLAPGDPTPIFGHDFQLAPAHPLGRLDWDLIARAFIDAGTITNNQRLSFERDNTLVGAGVGLELTILRNFSARADWGVALHDADNGTDRVTAGSSRFHLQFTLSY